MNCLVCNTAMKAKKNWLWRCPACAFLFSTLPAGAGTGVEGLESLRRENFETLLDRLEKHAPVSGKNILEVGCSTGFFLEAAARRGGAVTGLEPEREKAAVSRHKGFTVIDGFFPDALPAGKTFDVMVFNDVFEHLPNPSSAMAACLNFLAPEGILVLNLPDSGGILYKIASLMDAAGSPRPLDRLWQKDFPSPHISYFNSKNLRTLAEGKNLRMIYSGRLKSMSVDGLKERIAASYQGVPMAMIYSGLRALMPLQNILPPDITLQFYRKSA